MIVPVTEESAPELAADSRNKWREIGKRYWQTDTKDGITLEIRQIESGMYRWWLYDDNSPEPDLAVILSDPDAATLAQSLADAYDYLEGYQPT